MRVFTPKEIESRRIPSPGQFLEVQRSAQSGFRELWDNPPIGKVIFLGAIMIGSTARGIDVSCTSDIDVVVFYDDRGATSHSRLACGEAFRPYYLDALCLALRFNIPMNVYNIYWSRLASGETRHTRQFLKHVMNAMNGFGGATALGFLAGNERKVKEIFAVAPEMTSLQAKAYIAGKLEKMSDAWLSWGGLSQEKAALFLGNCFNAPFHGARHVLDVKGLPYEDTKQGVIEAISRESKEMGDSLGTINTACHAYGLMCANFAKGKGQGKTPTIANSEKLYRISEGVLSGLLLEL